MGFYITGRTEISDHVPFTSYALKKDGHLVEIVEHGNRFSDWARFETAREAHQVLNDILDKDTVHLQVTVM